jgi:hypothetical protein
MAVNTKMMISMKIRCMCDLPVLFYRAIVLPSSVRRFNFEIDRRDNSRLAIFTTIRRASSFVSSPGPQRAATGFAKL